ncbi:MAG TPA: protein kinase [Pseudomonadota bacterium]|nr:protein kinase [Pseudomonadota bacterium]
MIEAGSRIGNYKLTRLLGEGGMGRVFEGVHEQIGRRAAIKVLHAQFAHNSEAYTRFLNEARAVNIIQHPGLVNVFEFGQTDDGSPYIVMEFLEGQTLADRLASVGRMSMGALRIARQIASALMAAHAKHIVHRDLKPANVMLVPDPDMPGGERVKVVDFGIAKISAEHNDTGYKTRAGAILGTPTYMSPEQCRGAGEVTEKTDVYALGVMLYEMLIGHPPFVAEGGGEIMGMHLFQAPPALHTLEPSLPLDLVDLVHSMLSKAPEARPSIVQVAQELDRIGGRLSGPMQAVSAELQAEPKPPGPLTIPLDVRRQAEVTSVSGSASGPVTSASAGAPSTATPSPATPVGLPHPVTQHITPSFIVAAPPSGSYATPYITPVHFTPPYVTPAPYGLPVTPSGVTPPLAPPPPAPSDVTPPLAPPPPAPSDVTPPPSPGPAISAPAVAEASIGESPAPVATPDPQSVTLIAPDSSEPAVAPAAQPATPADGGSSVPSALAAGVAQDSGGVKASPHAPTIGVSSAAGPIVSPVSPAPVVAAAPVLPAGPDVAAGLSPLSTAVVASAGPVRPPAPSESADKRSLTIVLVGLGAAALILVGALVLGLMLRSRALQPASDQTATDAATAPTAPGTVGQPPVPQPMPSVASGPPPSPVEQIAPPDMSSAPAVAAPSPASAAPADSLPPDAGVGERDNNAKKKKPLLRRKKGLRNEEIEYLD